MSLLAPALSNSNEMYKERSHSFVQRLPGQSHGDFTPSEYWSIVASQKKWSIQFKDHSKNNEANVLQNGQKSLVIS